MRKFPLSFATFLVSRMLILENHSSVQTTGTLNWLPLLSFICDLHFVARKDKELVLQLTLIICMDTHVLDIIIQHQTDSIEGCLQKLTCALEKKGSIFSLKSYIWIVYLLYTVNILGP